LYDIISNIKINNSIFEIKEFITTRKWDGNTESDLFIVTQRPRFLYNKDLQIYVNTYIDNGNLTDGKNDSKAQIEKITITLYSYKSSIDTIQTHVEKIKNEYLNNIEKSRVNKRYIYSLISSKEPEQNYDCWKEYEFETTRTFDNMFFEGKKDILNKVDFFLNNKQWYYDNGIPYSLGIGLHGPPGTGKTSFFKSLARMTGRHIVVISLKLIKTKNQLEQYFYEDTYNDNNKLGSIGFSNKIIIFEDIDCMGDIVWNREKRDVKEKETKQKDSNNEIVSVLQKLVDKEDSTTSCLIKPSVEDAPITLDDILNVFDGLKETPGRIIGISSNYYDKLDQALIRPGRIDITINLYNATREIIAEMFSNYYKEKMSPAKVKKIKDRFYSPAEIINCYVLNKDDPENFISRLIQNKKF
jgi:chaperone BCS1